MIKIKVDNTDKSSDWIKATVPKPGNVNKGEKRVLIKAHETKSGVTVKDHYRIVKTKDEKVGMPGTPVGMTVEEFEKNPIEGFVYKCLQKRI